MTASLREVRERVLDLVLEEIERTRAIARKHHGDKLSGHATAVLDILVTELKLKLGPHAMVWRELAVVRDHSEDEDVQ